MITIFLFLHKPFLGKFGFSRVQNEEKSQNYKFNKILLALIIASWILTGIMLSVSILQIPLRDPAFPHYPDKFSLGILWSFSVLLICILVTSIINRTLPNEKRIEKSVLKSATYGGAIIAFGIWFIQLVIFEVYLHKGFGFEIIMQDIRVLTIVVSGLYITFFFNLLKGKLLPEASEKSTKRVEDLLDSEIMKLNGTNHTNETEILLEDQSDSGKEKVIRYPQGISLKAYVYIQRKFYNTQSLDDNTLSNSKFNTTSNKIIAILIIACPIILISILRMLNTVLVNVIFLSGLYSLLMIIGVMALILLLNKINPFDNRELKILFISIPIIAIFLVSVFYGQYIIMLIVLTFNIPLLEVFYLSLWSAFFMVLGDISITYLVNKINPSDRQTSKILLQQSAIFGGLITFLIWLIPIFVIYLYVFILIDNIIILNITYITVLSLALFTVGSRVLWWYATSIKMWDAAMKSAPYIKKKAAKVNLIWLIVNIPVRIILFIFIANMGIYFSESLSTFWADDVWPTEYELLMPILINEFIIAVINIIIGVFLVLKIYKRKLGESFKFLILSYIVLYLAAIFLNLVLGLFQSLIISYHYSLTDLRIPLLLAVGIYMISILGSLRIRLDPDTSEKAGDRFRAALKPYEDRYETFEEKERAILDVQNLTTYFYTEEGVVKAVEGVSFKIYEGETLGLVGETGCGKSVTALSILRLVRPPGKIKSGKVFFEGEDLHQKTEQEFLKYRGNRITMIFQDPLNSLNPVYKIGDQIAEVYRLHMEDELLIEAVKRNTSIYDIARKWSRKLLKDLNIPTPRIIFDRYPHELSGGMRQRVQIAMGLACSPKLLIADEPTTALDVTIQNQILQLMKDLKKKYNTSILFITHDLGIISKMCDRVAVMYSGFIVEYGDINKLFRTPYHPYTRGLIASVPVVGKKREVLEVIPGMVPNLIYPPSGCRFHPRCQYCFEPCDSKIPKSIEVEPNYLVACHLFDPEHKDLAETSIRKAES